MMNHFERTAIFTVITNMEQQLQGLKTLIAASGNSGTVPCNTASKRSANDPTSIYTNEQEDTQMDAMLDAKAATAALEREAQARMQVLFEAASKANAEKEKSGQTS